MSNPNHLSSKTKKELISTIDRLQSEADTVDKLYDELAGRCSALALEKARLLQENSQLQGRIVSLEAKLQDEREAVGRLEARCNELRDLFFRMIRGN